ncbi:MAG: phosphate transport system regulatory protein PhoU [Verrucomicrobia bacterium]|nr:phosphate transport system regulatory protein PhoU [Verrucomicrobiota bacterium]NBU09017.1 phosphate transport system regulatory protein PhoU [Pseudomonadota bacterium]NDA66326.1 phosphate transport system regulatory protein PhoU [Verrucomicrobiota bacterium]NDB75027.1 phosphate transport system regulatory protein PhoU [Verrucomicrobiota bacterium]NDD38353.1 phosphate transport system regulatory protein PhoU [Verrucomicrobiota bacterium]
MLPHDHEFAVLKEKLLTMSSLAASSLQNAIKSLVERNDDLARQVEQADDQLDALEIELDELAIVLLSRGPIASDLRMIAVAMKITHDLERVGDEATAIARSAVELNKEPQLKPYVDIPRMATMALEMLNDSLEAFVSRDTTRARAVLPRDKDVDALNRQLHRELISYMLERPSVVTRALHLMQVSKRIERIADHATNIAEEVVYLYEGRDIRHTGKDAHA